MADISARKEAAFEMSSTSPADEKRSVHSEDKSPQIAEQARAGPRPPLSRMRQFLIASAPCVVWFAGVSSTIFRAELADLQTMQVCGVGFLLPVIQDKLNSSDGQVQWVRISIEHHHCMLTTGQLGFQHHLGLFRSGRRQTVRHIWPEEELPDWPVLVHRLHHRQRLHAGVFARQLARLEQLHLAEQLTSRMWRVWQSCEDSQE